MCLVSDPPLIFRSYHVIFGGKVIEGPSDSIMSTNSRLSHLCLFLYLVLHIFKTLLVYLHSKHPVIANFFE